MTEVQRRTVLVDGLATSYLEAGQGDPVVLLHGGEFGASAELGWENNIAALAAHHRVLAPDMLGFGDSAKVIDFNDGRGMRIRHIARFCDAVGVESAHFVGNSMGAVNMLVDATSESRVLPARSMVTICGGGEIQRNEHSAALYDYDATLSGMRRIVAGALLRPVLPGRRRLRATALRVEHRARCVGSDRRGDGFGGPGWSRRRYRRALGHTSASPCQRWWWRGSATNSCRRGGRQTSRVRSRAVVRLSFQRPVTARRSNNHRWSTNCWWTS